MTLLCNHRSHRWTLLIIRRESPTLVDPISMTRVRAGEPYCLVDGWPPSLARVPGSRFFILERPSFSLSLFPTLTISRRHPLGMIRAGEGIADMRPPRSDDGTCSKHLRRGGDNPEGRRSPGYVRTLEVREFGSKLWLAVNFTSGRSFPLLFFFFFFKARTISESIGVGGERFESPTTRS